MKKLIFSPSLRPLAWTYDEKISHHTSGLSSVNPRNGLGANASGIAGRGWITGGGVAIDGGLAVSDEVSDEDEETGAVKIDGDKTNGIGDRTCSVCAGIDVLSVESDNERLRKYADRRESCSDEADDDTSVDWPTGDGPDDAASAAAEPDGDVPSLC